MKRGLLFFLSIVLCFSLVSVVTAEESNATRIDVKEIIPQEYLDEYKAKYTSFEEVFEAFGMKTTEMNQTEKKSDDGFNIETPDELAAYVAFMKDQATNIVNETETPEIETSQNVSARSSVTTRTYGQTFFDAKIYWIKGYTTIDFTTSSSHITQTSARSTLHGFTNGLTWRPAEPHITVLSSISRRVTYGGQLDHAIFYQNIGTFWSQDIQGTQVVSSINIG